MSNGLRLRVLRDNASLTRPAYLEFDLEEESGVRGDRGGDAPLAVSLLRGDDQLADTAGSHPDEPFAALDRLSVGGEPVHGDALTAAIGFSDRGGGQPR